MKIPADTNYQIPLSDILRSLDTISVYQNQCNFYIPITNNEEIFKIMCIAASKNINCPGINLMIDVWGLNTENSKHYWKNERWLKFIEQYIMFIDWKTQYLRADSSLPVDI